jgi:protein-S-isoprenylcysteine O-methyltransferase Ste14
MPRYFAAFALVLLIGLVLVRARLLKRQGIKAIHFGSIDKKDFLVPPFALFYFYTVFAAAFNLPTMSKQEFFHSEMVSWAGVLFCAGGLFLFAWSLVSFGKNFRVGIDTAHAGKLVTTGAFGISRNPIYVAFALVLIGQFLVFPNVILLIYFGAAVWLFHRQVLREEAFLKTYYGQEFTDYSRRVRRYF